MKFYLDFFTLKVGESYKLIYKFVINEGFILKCMRLNEQTIIKSIYLSRVSIFK